ncbi:MAG: O-antigen ligase family protein [Candidatus Shapirobacteria bacterium]|nr:O-antigen ligase family protein [Candidatus Shapirobacteria bacterium]
MKSISGIIKFGFLFLLFFTPLIFTSFNSELFELPKMYFVYLITLIILTLHLINFFQNKSKLLSTNLLVLPLFLFLLSQGISTYFSVDQHTSIFGYYSRLNGGLLSLISYIILFLILTVYIDKPFIQKIINVSLISGLIVSIYAIAEHFGIDKDIWLQDVQNRVFSTFGQPNWLAAYLCILIPIGLAQSVEYFYKKNKILFLIYDLSAIIFFLALLFTKSKSGIIAAIISLGLFFILSFLKNKKSLKLLILNSSLLILFSLSINNPIKDLLFPQKLKIADSKIENLNITPSEDIRKIVWKGALELWQKFPLFGTGVETFAYSYYWTRPAEHNLTSEWDFLYNKAHNEYINYLATTGALGLLTYSIFIGAILLLFVKTILKDKDNIYLNLGLLTAFISILITNIAGFSVVVISLYFFLLPVLISKDKSSFIFSFNFPKFISATSSIVIIIVALFLGQKTLFFYLADITYAQASEYDDQNKYNLAYERIQESIAYRNDEPVYLDKASSVTAKMALVAHSQKNDALTQKYIYETENYSNQALLISPANINFWKERAQSYYYLSSIDPKYFQNAITALSKATILAPTDAKSFYLLGKFLQTANLSDKAIPFYQKAIELKFNYDYAYFDLAKIYFDSKNYSEAKKYFQMVLKYAPDSQESKDYLNKIK